MMPSVNSSAYASVKQDKNNQSLGYDNYLNGVPVSIQLDGNAMDPNIAKAQPKTWKQNMNRRNELLNNTDLNKMHLRNQMEIQKEGMLPNIGANVGL